MRRWARRRPCSPPSCATGPSRTCATAPPAPASAPSWRTRLPSSSAGSQRQVEAVTDLGRVLSRLCRGHAEALVSIDLAGEGIGDVARRLGKSYQAMNGQVGHARAAARRVALELAAA